ncbi:YtxH domain-containing protein [Peptostreptococcus faecalis]|uniref:YtxH domain-containing protein n=1 Tax=Peptostreptococcus faecalis TaxID=2045015 RepID=UPI0015E13F93|nr:YtxH domain-containing protein [Peptostreptococcus faecalis]
MGLTNVIKRKRREAEKKKRKEKALKYAKIAAASATVGVVSGVLIAPQSGKETIGDIKEGASNTGKAIAETSKSISDKTTQSIEDTKSKIKDSKHKIKDYFDKKEAEIEVIALGDSADSDVSNEANSSEEINKSENAEN